MKLLSYRVSNGVGNRAARVGVQVDGRVVDVDDQVAQLAVPQAVADRLAGHGLLPAARGMLRLLQAGPDAWQRLSVAPGTGLALAEVELLAPLPRPGKIVAIGRNYADHAKETGVSPFEQPRIISKLPSSVCGPGSLVRRPEGVSKLDFEVELAVVIGSFAQRVSQADALAHVAGYTVLDDISARDFQFDVNPAQTTFAMSMDGFCPMGPWLVTRDEIDDPQALEVSCHVNGQPMQHARGQEIQTPFFLPMTASAGQLTAPGTVFGIGCDA